MSKTVRRIITTAIIIIAIIALTIIMVINTSSKTRKNAIDHMKSITNQEASMIKSFVENAESTLLGFGASPEVKTLLKSVQGNKEIASADNAEDLRKAANKNVITSAALNDAQKYTEEFSKNIVGIEGLWVGDWNTHCLTHTNPMTPGMTTRKTDEARKPLLDGLLSAGDKVYNLGIIMSPATNKQIVSMYKIVKDDDGNPLGFVGLGIFTDKLVEALRNVESDSTFYMVNSQDNKYIFHNDNDKVATEAEDSEILKLTEKYKNSIDNEDGDFEENSNVTFYSYMSDNHWILFNETPSSEVFEFSRSINIEMIIFCAVCIILIIIFNIVSIRQEATLQRLEQSKRKQAAITKNLHIAALKDILTDVNNRIKFVDDFGKDDDGNSKIADCPNAPYCFAMYSISRFSEVNINYGHDVGDAALASTADILKEKFGAQSVYRTGSDEFVVAIKSDTSDTHNVVMDVNETLGELMRPRKLGNDIVSLQYAAAVVKKGTAISPAVLITLKDIINKNGVSMDNTATYVDMDAY
jgi:diguanylate cyclase (GGDEF)-like protein